jgi:hypothetical protein
MAERLDLLMDIPEDIFKQTYNTYQVASQSVPSQRPYYIPAVRSRYDAIEINDFLVQQIAVFPQYSTDYVPQYSSNKTLYPTLDLDYTSPSDVTPSTNLYPQLFDQTPLPSSAYVGVGSRMSYDQTRLVYSGTLTKARPSRADSEELVDDMEKMDVDSESKKKPEEEEVKVTTEDDKGKEIKAKHLEVIKKLQRMVQEMILDWENEEEVKVKESPVSESVSVAAP